MTVSSIHRLRRFANIDIVGDRHVLLSIGMSAVFAACVAFGIARLALTLSSGVRTPWWANLAGAAVIVGLFLWYRQRPETRSAAAAHGTGLVATAALVIPIAYGMRSTIWWLGLVGFAMVLLGRRREAWAWGVAIPVLTVGAVLAEPVVQLPGAAGETTLEHGMARVAFVSLLVGMAAAFRRAAVNRAAELYDSEERYRGFFDHAPVGIVHFDTKMIVTAQNQHVGGILCGAPGDLTGLDLHVLPDARVLPALHAALDGESGEYDGPYASGPSCATTFLSLRTAPLRRRGGAIAGGIAILEDATERRWMEAELRRSRDQLEDRVRERTRELTEVAGRLTESEARLRLLIDHAPAALAMFDRDMRYLAVSRRWMSDYGLGNRDVIGLSHYEVFPEIPERWKVIHRRGMRGETVETEEDPFARADGSVQWLKWLVRPWHAAGGDVGGIVIFSEDITQRKHAEAALRESEQRYRSLFEQSPIGIYRTTPDGSILLANPALVRMCGYDSMEELLARNLEDEGFQPDYPRSRFKDSVERSGELRGFEAVWRTKDGRRLFVRENAHAIRDAEGEVQYYEGAVEDITARRAAEEAHQRLAAAVEQAAEAVVITDRDGTIQYVNPAFERITGYGGSEALGQTMRLVRSGRQDSAFYQEMWQTITSGQVWSGHIVNRRKDGTDYQEEMTISPVRDEKGRVAHYVAVKRDVTHEVALRQQLTQAQRMEAIGRLAGGIAHDFNNLLQALMTHAQLLRAHAEDAAKVRLEASELEQGVSRGASLTRQLLLFSRRETTQPELLDLNQVLRSATAMLRRLVHENVAIELELSGRPVAVEADRGQLDQVLMNLVVNASDAMPDGGRIAIRSDHGGDEVWFEVEDSGNGIPEAIREHIFEPFFTTKGAGKGTGLGLSVVHGIVAQHGGRVDLTTQEGHGSCFRVVLPGAASRDGAGTASTPATATELPRGAGERVLVVEDEEGARDGLREILASLGYRVTAVGSGAEAGRLPAQPDFELLLTDLMLPDVSGNALAATLLARWPELAVIFMSGYSEDEAVRRGIEAGSVRFLQKPFDMHALATAVRLALEERRKPREPAKP